MVTKTDQNIDWRETIEESLCLMMRHSPTYSTAAVIHAMNKCCLEDGHGYEFI